MKASPGEALVSVYAHTIFEQASLGNLLSFT